MGHVQDQRNKSRITKGEGRRNEVQKIRDSYRSRGPEASIWMDWKSRTKAMEGSGETYFKKVTQSLFGK